MENTTQSKAELPASQDVDIKRPVLRRVSTGETERPPSAQQARGDADVAFDTSEDNEMEEEDSDPADRIADFDWEDLHTRYHEAIKKCSEDEEALMQEWESLMSVRLHLPVVG